MPRQTISAKTKIFDAAAESDVGKPLGYKVTAVTGDVLIGMNPGDNTETLTHRLVEGDAEFLRASRLVGQGHIGHIQEIWAEPVDTSAVIDHRCIERTF